MASVNGLDEAGCAIQESRIGSGTELLKEEKEKEVSVKNSKPNNELYHEKILFFVLLTFNILSVILLIIMGILLLGLKSSPPKPVAELCFPRVAIEGHPYDRNIAYYNETHYCYQNLSSIGPVIGNDTYKADRRTYRCRYCPKSGRKCRVVSHIYRDHIPTDRLPYYCSLCHFRCEKELDLKQHLTEYGPHQQADLRAGGVRDLTPYLHKATDPYFVGPKDLVQLSLGEINQAFTCHQTPQVVGEKGCILPGWLANNTLPPPPTTSQDSTSYVASVYNPEPTYIPTPKQLLPVNPSTNFSIMDFNEDLLDQLSTPGPSTPLLDETVLPTTTDKSDPLFQGLTPSIRGVSPPPKSTTQDTSAQTDTPIDNQMVALLKRIASASEEQLKVSLRSERKINEVVSELKRLERKVNHIEINIDSMLKIKKTK